MTTNHGKIDQYFSGFTADRMLDIFVGIKKAMDFFCTAPGGSLFELVASQYGKLTDGNAATGLDYHDGANPCGDNAFVVYRSLKTTKVKVPYEVMFQFNRGNQQTPVQSGGYYFGAAPGNPGTCRTYDSSYAQLAVAAAACSNGTSPWAGTTAKNGTDTKGTPVWAAQGTIGVGNLIVLPRQNATGGEYVTNKEHMAEMILFNQGVPPTTGASRMHVLASDEGHLLIAIAGNDDAMYTSADTYGIASGMMFLGPVDDVHPAITPDVNLLMLARQANGNSNPYGLWASDHISSTIRNDWLNGGCAHPDSSRGTVSFYNYIPNFGASPNTLLPTDTCDARECEIILYDPVLNPVVNGFYGQCTWIKTVYNLLSESQNAAKTITILGRTDAKMTYKNAVPWDGATPVGGTVRAGVEF